MSLTIRPGHQQGRKTASPGASLGCVCVFMLPFFGFGVTFMVIGIRDVMQGGTGGYAAMAFASLFLLISVGVVIASLFGYRTEKEREQAQATNPDRPWLWRPDWAAGVIESGGVGPILFAWGISLFWNAISWPGVLVALPRELEKGNKAALFILLFPIVGLALLAWAMYATLQWKRFGRSWFHLSPVPGVLGGELTGYVQVNNKITAPKGYNVRLWVVRRMTTGTGKNRHTSEDLLWEETQVVTRDAFQHERERTAIPVHFAIPYDLPASEDGNPAIVWRLTVKADIPGVDYHTQFDVPVFRTADSSEKPQTKGAEAAPETPPTSFVPPANTRIQVRDLPDGVEVHFPAARNPGVIVGTFFFAAIWTGILVLVIKKAPIFFAIVWGLFDVIILMILMGTLFHSTRVVATRSGMRIFHRLLFPISTRNVAGEDIQAIVARPTSRSGSKTYYGLRVERRSGTDYSAGEGIPDKRHAEWLAARMAAGAGITGEEG